MGSCTKSAATVGQVCSGMKVRNLNRRAENQQQCTAKSKSNLPGLPHASFCLLMVHHSNYNLPWDEGASCGQKGPLQESVLVLKTTYSTNKFDSPTSIRRATGELPLPTFPGPSG
jgi:hypothetical protein